MVAIISKNGGMAGVVLKFSKYARSSRSSQMVTWILGVAIFFDDYANTLIVGNTMRSVTDRFRISREKLAYLVDSTAAPIAAVAFITTWIGAELGYIDSGLEALRSFHFEMTPYAVFISSLRYAFYPVLTLAFMVILIYTGRDFGPMLKAERRARETGRVSSALTPADDEPNMEELGPVAGAPLRWYNAAIPVGLVILVTIYGLVETGMQGTYSELLEDGITVVSSSWSHVWGAMPSLLAGDDPGFFQLLGKIIGNADSYKALLWSSLMGVTAAIILTVSQRISRLFDTMHILTTGFKTMMPALIILTLAWSLAAATNQLHTADYLTSLIQGSISPHLMPALIFVLAAVIAFSTGSSWSTMAILYPIAIPTTWAVCLAAQLDPDLSLEILLNVIATVMSASVVGDHCSPISDTTILSSLACDCNHIDHVRTQMPYALTVAAMSLICSVVATYHGGGWGISFVCVLLSLGVLYVIVRKKGKPTLNYTE
jgi:Na+/H+ antiporter NhaC